MARKTATGILAVVLAIPKPFTILLQWATAPLCPLKQFMKGMMNVQHLQKLIKLGPIPTKLKRVINHQNERNIH